MPVGICKLCLMSKPLRDSHFMPRGMYKRIRDPSKRNASPVVVTRERTTKTFRQTKEYVLCADCEQRFNLSGEDWMLKKLGAGKRLNRCSQSAQRTYAF